MTDRRVTAQLLDLFRIYLLDDEKSLATIEKYLRDIRHLMDFLDGREVSKALMLEYKEQLRTEYALTSANSMLAAVNSLLRFAGWGDCCVRRFKVQNKVYCSEERELSRDEYIRLVNAAKAKGNRRMDLIMQTICGTGIRVSELEFITVEAARSGEATVNCKGKTRTVFIVQKLRKKLLNYAKRAGIRTGSIFIGRTGRPVSRCNIWRDMKRLCRDADVAETKVFPHNLRHLFARIFYSLEKDIAKLADILGHANINTTRVYIITTGAEHRRKMERMQLIL